MPVAGTMSDGVNSHLGSGGSRYYRPWHRMTRGLISSLNNPLRHRQPPDNNLHTEISGSWEIGGINGSAERKLSRRGTLAYLMLKDVVDVSPSSM